MDVGCFLLFLSDCGQNLMSASLELQSKLSICNWMYMGVLITLTHLSSEVITKWGLRSSLCPNCWMGKDQIQREQIGSQ